MQTSLLCICVSVWIWLFLSAHKLHSAVRIAIIGQLLMFDSWIVATEGKEITANSEKKVDDVFCHMKRQMNV